MYHNGMDTHVNRIMQLCDYIDDELHGAKKYLKLAMKMKTQDKANADIFYKMGEAELSHAEALTNMATKEVHDAKEAGDDMKTVMDCVYNWENGKHVEKMAEIRKIMEMYKS